MLPTITLKIDGYTPPSRPEKPEKVGTVDYSLPSVFYDAHANLSASLPAGELLYRNATNTVRVRLDAEAFDALLHSAQQCISNGNVPQNIRTSAQRTINKLLSHKRPRPVEAAS